MRVQVDRVSFILGMMTAFGECVAGEAKRLALSPPFFPDDLPKLSEEAQIMAEEQDLKLFLEVNQEMREEDRVLWWVMYKFDEELDHYLELRQLGWNPAWDFDEFRELLGYGLVYGEGAMRIKPRMRKETNGMDPVTRIVFPDGGWPVQK